MAILRVRKGSKPGLVFPLLSSRQPLVIGRDPRADVCLEDSRASRRNCAVSLVLGRWWLKDLGSSNGTFLNGKRVERAELVEGAGIQVGATLLLFHEKQLPAFPDLELADTRPVETVRESSGVFTFQGRQTVLDREVRLDWVHPSKTLADDILGRIKKATEEAVRLHDVAILPIICAEGTSDGIFLVLKGDARTSLEDRLAEVLAAPLSTRLHLFRQIVQVVLERAGWDDLRSPIGLRGIGLEVHGEDVPLASIPPLDLSALVAEHTGDLSHIPDFARYLPPEYQEGDRSGLPPLASTMYNLGALGYHLLTGRPPAGEGDLESVLENHRRLTPAPADLVAPEVPTQVAQLLSSLLQKDPARRPAGRMEVLEQISAASASAAPSPVPGRPPSAPRSERTSRIDSPAVQAAPSVAPRATEAPRERVFPSRRAAEAARERAAGRREIAARQLLLYLPLWTLAWVGLFFAARHIARIIFRSMEGS